MREIAQKRKNILAVLFFVFCFGMTAFYLLAGYGAYLDSDMSSELVLAKQLASECSILTSEWYYSTEVRLLNTQLIFAPLMAIMPNNWRMVRTVGCIILLMILAASSLFVAKQLGAKRHYAIVFAGLNICVYSPLYAQNVIIGAYYVPHAALSMLLVGLYAVYLRTRKWRYAVGALLLSFALGISSVRYVVIVIVPLFAATLWIYAFPAKEEQMRNALQNKAAGLGMFIAVAGTAGYLTFQKVFGQKLLYEFDYYNSMGYTCWYTIDLAEQIQSALYGLLYAAGFEGGIPLMCAHGIQNALVLLMLFVSVVVLVRQSRQGEEVSEDSRVRLGRLTLIFAAALSMATFVLLRGLYFDRYWLPIMMFGAPVMATCLSKERSPVFRRLTVLLFVGTVLITSASCMYYSMHGTQVEEETRMPAIEAARTLGINKGYATFWNANVLTELSNGEIEMVPMKKETKNGEQILTLFPWLVTESALEMDRPDKPVFLLIDDWEGEKLDAFLAKTGAREYEIEGWINMYIIPTQRQLFDAMGIEG